MNRMLRVSAIMMETIGQTGNEWDGGGEADRKVSETGKQHASTCAKTDGTVVLSGLQS